LAVLKGTYARLVIYTGIRTSPLQVIARPDGEIVWVSGPLPGAVHDMTAARIWGIVAELAASGLVVLGDKGYRGGDCIRVPYRRRNKPASIYEQIPQASQQALDAVSARCASDPACHGAFPHLAAEWAQLRASLAARPVTLPAAQSPTSTTIQLDNDGLASEVHQLLTGADTAVYVPLLIQTLATAKNKTAALATVLRQIQMAGRPLGGFLPESAISYPTRCAEPWARYQPGQIADPNSYYYQYIKADAQFWQYACTLIPAPGAAASYGPPKPSNVPVLMINGTADLQDPPANMSGAQDIWPNSRLLAEPGQSHEIDFGAWTQCDAGLIQAFVEHANARQLNASCLTQVALPSFPAHW
jgi:hypothetical protein